jgi:hypothetical protein
MAIKWHSREALAVTDQPHATMKKGVKIEEHLRDPGEPGVVAEFIGTDNFSSEWYSRQQFEVDAGSDEEPILYTPIYDEVNDPNLPRHVTVHSLGPAGVVFERFEEGGEVKFMSVGGSSRTAEILKWDVGLEYSKDLVMYNEMWRMAPIERGVGTAHNALLNHIHFNPILTATYTSANQTAGSSTATTVSALLDEYIVTLEDAIVASQEDTTNPRRGPYTLLIAAGQQFRVSNALKRRLQDGINEQSDAIQAIRNVIIYNGWTGTRGAKSTTYAGVTSGKAYLISLQYKMQDFQSFVKQSLEAAMGNADVSRFILEQIVYDVHRGVYANPLRAVEEITWPTLAE